MLGAIIGDVAGSLYEFGSCKSKDFPFFGPGCRPTDDSVMTIAVGCACQEADCYDKQDFQTVLVEKMQTLGRMYPSAGYGGHFVQWLEDDDPQPYGSMGNGSAMRVSPVGWAMDTLEETERLAKWSAEVTHDHPDGIRGAQAVAAAIFLARNGADKKEIRDYIQQHYYDLSFTLDEIRPGYSFSVTCEGSVPQAIVAFLEAEDFADAVRNAISLGGDGDTQACIAGAIAEAFFGIPEQLQEQVMDYLDETLQDLYFSYTQFL